uniref:6-cysteine protein n=1 Tax=Strongyloides venezuelensis TaxID=75913 RepID=A0A0K0FA70_STRVS
MHKLSLCLFYILILSKGQSSYQQNIRDECKLQNAQRYNSFFKNQQIHILANDCSFINYDQMFNYTSKNNICENSSSVFLMSQELLEKDIKTKLIYIIYKNISSERFDSIKVYEEESNVYYVPKKPITEAKDILIIEKINCRIDDIIINYLNSNYNKMKNALFLRLTTDFYEQEKIVFNLYIALPDERKNINIEKYILTSYIKNSHLTNSVNEVCTNKSAFHFYEIKPTIKISNYFGTQNNMNQLLIYNNYIVTVEKIPRLNGHYYQEKVIKLKYYKDGMKPVTICLDEKIIKKPIYISFYNGYTQKNEPHDENNTYTSIRNKIIYIVMIVIIILIIILSCRNIKKEYNAILNMDREIQKKIFGKKKGKKLNEILNEKLQQQHFNNDDGIKPIIPYVKFDKRFNEIKKIPKKRVTGMEIKTLTKNIEYISS